MKRKFTMSVLIFSMSFLLFNHTHLSAETSSSEELEKVDKTHGIVQLPSLNVYSGSNEEYEVIGELDDYVRVELEGETSNGWYKINDERFSEEAYILGSYIVPVDIPEYEEGYVDGDLVNVREGPNADEAGVAELDQGQQVEIIGEIDDWYKLKLDDVSGPTYVNGSYISSEDPDALDETDQSASEETHTLTEIDYSHGVVQSSSLNVRTGPSSENELIGSLDNYARVEVEGETSDGWYKINGEEFSEEAYVSASAIVPVNEPEYEEGYVKGDIVNVREGPSEDETDVAQLEQGEQVEVVGEINGWYKLKLNDVSGPTYVNGSYINSEDPDALDETEESASEEIQVAETDERTFEETQYLTEPEYSHGVVQSSYLNVRSGPGTDHETIGGLEDYTRVELEGETSDGWYQISGEGF
ncbi:SH3 domain-containing protein, partial [Natribacillus halophilus]